MIKVYENEYATVYVYPEKKLIHHQFHKFIYGNEFRNALQAGKEAFLKYKCTKWLSDDRGNSALKKEDVEWGQKEWEPDLFKAGWKYWALIMPNSAAGRLSMKGIIEHYKTKGLTIEIFENEDDAMKWLDSKN